MHIRVRKQNFTTIYITITILLLSLHGTVIKAPFISFCDELFALFSIFEIVMHWKKSDIGLEQIKLRNATIIAVSVIIVVGLVSNVFSELVGIGPILIDAFGIVKLQATFMYGICVLSEKNQRTIVHNIRPLAKIFIVTAFAFGAVNAVTDIGMSFDIRYGIRSFEFFYNNPGGLNATLFVAYAIVLKGEISKRKSKIYMLLMMATVIMTLRGAGIGVLVVLLSLNIFNYYKKMNRPVNIRRLIPVFLLACVGAWNQIVEYYISGISLRSLVLRNSLVVMKRYFPLGAGFATYGSDQAFKHYSPLYYEFGYNDIYMLDKEHGYVANDNYWPMMLAQFGIIGTAAFLYLLYKQFSYILKLRIDSELKIVLIGLLSVLLIGSTGNAVYTSASGLLIYLIIGVVL